MTDRPQSGLALGLCIDRQLPARQAVELAVTAESGGFDDVWIVEDAFYTSGVVLAAAAQQATKQINVGLGVVPAVTRHPAQTAMDLATLSALAPGRFIAGIGHGVQVWMHQMGLRQASPIAALEETIDVVRRLLAGETVTVTGRFTHLDEIRLQDPPDTPPPVLAGVRGPRSLSVAGRCADGLILAEFTGVAGVRSSIDAAGQPDRFEVAVYTPTHVDPDRREARRAAADRIAAAFADPTPTLRTADYFAEVAAAIDRRGANVLVDLDDAIWNDLAAVGDPDDVEAHLAALHAAGAHRVAFSPAADRSVIRDQLSRLLDTVVGPRGTSASESAATT